MGLRSLRTIINLTSEGRVGISNDFNQCHKYLYSNSATNNTTKATVKILAQFLRYSSDSPPKCWKCNYPHKSELFCTKCRALQEPPEDLNYFDVIGVKENYDVENAEVQQKYRQLQNLLHPDRFSNSTEKEKQISANLSSLVNKAYNTLQHPLNRGLYMLKLNNLTIPEGSTNLNPEFLMEIMERNEEVEEASEDKEKVMKIMAENREILGKLSREVSEAFQCKDIEKAKAILVKMKYYASIDAKLKALKQDLGIVE